MDVITPQSDARASLFLGGTSLSGGTGGSPWPPAARVVDGEANRPRTPACRRLPGPRTVTYHQRAPGWSRKSGAQEDSHHGEHVRSGGPGGTVYDGTGAPGARADVGVRGDRITGVGTIAERGGAELDATGLAVSPGFIDVHSHDDLAVLCDPQMAFKVLQGVTTDVVGNCGSGVIPFEVGLKRFRRLDPDAAPPPWDSFATYLRRVDEVAPSCNVAVLIGHGSLRQGAM